MSNDADFIRVFPEQGRQMLRGGLALLTIPRLGRSYPGPGYYLRTAAPEERVKATARRLRMSSGFIGW